MHLSSTCLILCLGLFVACNSVHDESKALDLPGDGYHVQLKQRSKAKIPSTHGEVYVGINDITGGQTVLTVADESDQLLRKPIHEGESLSFDFGSKTYEIECVELVNVLIGTDVGNFKLTESGDHPHEGDKVSEAQKIEALIQTVAASNVTFIRNGTEHSAAEAADHLRSKWKRARGKVKTLDQFIENIASKSSMSGRPYQVRTADGELINAADWYAQLH